jgi:hypothetical protein
MTLVLQKGRPVDTTGRLDKEIRTYDLLDSLGVEYDRVDHAPAMTMEDCKEVDEILESIVCKNLFLCNRQETAFYLLMIPDTKVFHTKDLSAQIGSFFCQAGIHGEIPGYHPRLCQCTRSDERYGTSGEAVDR